MYLSNQFMSFVVIKQGKNDETNTKNTDLDSEFVESIHFFYDTPKNKVKTMTHTEADLSQEAGSHSEIHMLSAQNPNEDRYLNLYAHVEVTIK